MSAPEAKEYGIVDEVLTNRELAAVGVAAGRELSVESDPSDREEARRGQVR